MIGDGVAFSSMVGLGESYLPAFTLALGYGSVASGLVTTLPMLAGAVLQLVTPAAVGLLRSHRRWVVLCAALQATSFVPLVIGALAGELEVWALYLSAALYWGLGMSTGPAWTAWATTLVPARIRPRFFARRAAASHAALFVALLLAGMLLEIGEERGAGLEVFAVLFLLALGARSVSTACLAAQSEPRPVPIGETRISPRVIREHIATGGHGQLLLFLLSFQLSVWIAAPYFAPYMLGPLGFSYLEFTVLTTSAFGARVVALPWIGRIAQRVGTKPVLAVATLGIIPLPVLWLISDSFWWLFSIQLLSGVAWAAFELGSLLSFFERIPVHGQTSVLTLYNLANASAIVFGSLIGATLLAIFDRPVTGFIVVLSVSSAARLLNLPLLHNIRSVANPEPIPALRTVSARPSSGGLQRPVLASRGEEDR